MGILIGIFNSIALVFDYVWWLILPLLAFSLFWNIRLIYIRMRFVNGIKWSFFELKIPENILKTPKAMEQVFSAMASIYSFGLHASQKYIDGKVEQWASFEIVGHAGGVNFYVRIPSNFRNLLESAIYSQYSAAELHEVEDYTEHLPAILPDKTYDIWGADLVLARDSYYPIKTYPYFEEAQEEKRIDPISAITEVMSNLKDDESIWLQILISPTGAATGNDWQKEGLAKIDEIAGRKAAAGKKGFISFISQWFKNLFWAPREHPVWMEEKKEDSSTAVKFLHPGEQEIVKAISNKISKFGYETVIRFIYIDKRDSFTSANVSAVLGAFHQYRLENMNLFRPYKKTITLKSGWIAKFFPKYKKTVEFSRKRKLFDGYVSRRFGVHNHTRPEKFSILNVEELATIYHVPTMMVEAPRLQKLEAKKAGPPAELPIE